MVFVLADPEVITGKAGFRIVGIAIVVAVGVGRRRIGAVGAIGAVIIEEVIPIIEPTGVGDVAIVAQDSALRG